MGDLQDWQLWRPADGPTQRGVRAHTYALPEQLVPISYQRNKLLNTPQIVDGYRLIGTFVGHRSRVVFVYLNTDTGEHEYFYHPLARDAI